MLELALVAAGLAAVIVWMIIIFLFSAEPASVSSETSDPFADAFIALFHPEYSSLGPDAQFELHEYASHVVRKAAHFTIYTILGFLLALACRPAEEKGGPLPAGLFALLLGALYAAGDEFHQSFVPGRSGQIKDVLLDSAGVLCGILVCAGVRALIRIMRGKKKKTDPGAGFSPAS